jgi:SAM-dependent methyltransferase
MQQDIAAFWNNRYQNKDFVYGTAPNKFLKEKLALLKPSSILLPADGEGRNGVHAALQGWQVTAFDISEEASKKALNLAHQNAVSINYQVSEVLDFTSNKQFDVLALIYAHFPAAIRKKAHALTLSFLKKGGVVIFEAFAKAQLGKPSGGPQNEEMLFSIDEIKQEFSCLTFNSLHEKTITLDEGDHHQGTAQVIRFLGIKK